VADFAMAHIADGARCCYSSALDDPRCSSRLLLEHIYSIAILHVQLTHVHMHRHMAQSQLVILHTPAELKV